MSTTADVKVMRVTTDTGSISIPTGRRLAIYVSGLAAGADLVVRFVVNQTPPWGDTPEPEARLLAVGGRVVARARVRIAEGLPEAHFHHVPTGQDYTLDVDGKPEDASILSVEPLGAPQNAPEPASDGRVQPGNAAQTGGVFRYHDRQRDRLISQDRATILAHARGLGGFYLMHSVGRVWRDTKKSSNGGGNKKGASNQTSFDDVQRVQERLWALGFLDEGQVTGEIAGEDPQDPTVAGILAFQKTMGLKQDGYLSPDAGVHQRLMGRGLCDPQFVHEPAMPRQRKKLLQAGHNPICRPDGKPLLNLAEPPEKVVIVKHDAPLARLIRAMDPGTSSMRHYDHVEPLDGVTIGVAHWPLNEMAKLFKTLWAEEPAREALLMRFKEFFEVDGNGVLWQLFEKDVARDAIDLDYGEIDLDAGLPGDADVRSAIEAGLKKTLLSESWFARSKTRTFGKRVYDLVWFRKAIAWVMRDRRLVEWQVRFWIRDVILPSQKLAVGRFKLETYGAIAAMISMVNSRSAWPGCLPSSGKSYSKTRWWGKTIAISYDKDTGKLKLKKDSAEVSFDWQGEPRQEWRAYVTWQVYWTLKLMLDKKQDLRSRNRVIWNTWFARAFDRKLPDHFKTSGSFHALSSLPASAHNGHAMERGRFIPDGFDPNKPETFAGMAAIVPSYQDLTSQS